MRKSLTWRKSLTCLVLPLLAAAPALAGDPSGIWLRESGASKVRISRCVEAYCGTIVWLKDGSGNAKLGQRVFFDMKEAGENRWEGKAFNPEDGRTYAGKMVLAGHKLTTSGCALGGLLCRSVKWSRAE